MKRFKSTCVFFVFLSIYTHASANLGIADCSLKGDDSCEIFMIMDRSLDDVSYKVKLVDSESGKEIFPYYDMNETLESVSLQKYGGRYIFSKEYLDSSKSVEFISFKYENKKTVFIKYYYIEGSIDINNSVRQWSGEVCDTSLGKIPEKKDALLLEAASGICINKRKLSNRPAKMVGNDVVFYLSQITDGKLKEEIPVIALDRKDTDNLSLAGIGCFRDCSKGATAIKYIGKLNNKFRVSIHLDYIGDNVYGYYYYENVKKKINLSGKKDGQELMLSAYLPEGKETFTGILEQGEFKGTWSNSARGKKYPFAFYMMLVQ